MISIRAIIATIKTIKGQINIFQITPRQTTLKNQFSIIFKNLAQFLLKSPVLRSDSNCSRFCLALSIYPSNSESHVS